MLYTSVHNPRIKEVCKLKEKKYRELEGLFLIEGYHLVEEANEKGILKEVFIKEGISYSSSVPFSIVSETVMKQLTDLSSLPDIIGLCEKEKETKIGNRIVILEDVQDPGNIGTIIRSAVAFHVDTVILTKGCADAYSPKVLRSAQGMHFHLSIIEKEVEEVLPILKEKQIPILGTKVTGGNRVDTLEKTGKFAIIMGNEGKGVKESTLLKCDTYVYIPMSPLCESLNVGVATSLLLYELDKD